MILLLMNLNLARWVARNVLLLLCVPNALLHGNLKQIKQLMHVSAPLKVLGITLAFARQILPIAKHKQKTKNVTSATQIMEHLKKTIKQEKKPMYLNVKNQQLQTPPPPLPPRRSRRTSRLRAVMPPPTAAPSVTPRPIRNARPATPPSTG